MLIVDVGVICLVGGALYLVYRRLVPRHAAAEIADIDPERLTVLGAGEVSGIRPKDKQAVSQLRTGWVKPLGEKAGVTVPSTESEIHSAEMRLNRRPYADRTMNGVITELTTEDVAALFASQRPTLKKLRQLAREAQKLVIRYDTKGRTETAAKLEFLEIKSEAEVIISSIHELIDSLYFEREASGRKYESLVEKFDEAFDVFDEATHDFELIDYLISARDHEPGKSDLRAPEVRLPA